MLYRLQQIVKVNLPVNILAGKGPKVVQCHVRLGGTSRDRPCPRPDPYRILRLRTANWVSAISCLATVSGMPS